MPFALRKWLVKAVDVVLHLVYFYKNYKNNRNWIKSALEMLTF